jgi:hypothetical protein
MELSAQILAAKRAIINYEILAPQVDHIEPYIEEAVKQWAFISTLPANIQRAIQSEINQAVESYNEF